MSRYSPRAARFGRPAPKHHPAYRGRAGGALDPRRYRRLVRRRRLVWQLLGDRFRQLAKVMAATPVSAVHAAQVMAGTIKALAVDTGNSRG